MAMVNLDRAIELCSCATVNVARPILQAQISSSRIHHLSLSLAQLRFQT